MERSVIPDSRLWLPPFPYAPYALPPGVWYEGRDDKRTNDRTKRAHPLPLQRHPRDRLHCHFRARHGGDAPLLRGGPRISAAARTVAELDRIRLGQQYAGPGEAGPNRD